MSQYQKIRSLSTGTVFEGIRYGGYSKPWNDSWPTEVAAFVLGLDPDTRTTVANERILDVVRPVLHTWNLAKGKADLEVSDQSSGASFMISLGDWVLRSSPSGPFAFVKQEAFFNDYEIVDVVSELADFIYEIFPWEGETYQAAAEKVASEVIRAGWSKKELS